MFYDTLLGGVQMGRYDRFVPRMNDEEDVQRYLKQFFEVCEWDVYTEVNSDDGERRADLIVEDEVEIGIEVKHWNGTRSASCLQDVIDQVFTYMDKKFMGSSIRYWAICPYLDSLDKAEPPVSYVTETVNQWGIGYLNLDRAHLYIDYQHGENKAKIPIGQQSEDYTIRREAEKYFETSDLAYIRELILDRTPDFVESESVGERKIEEAKA